MENKFKVGDEVVCIDDSGSNGLGLQHGRLYKIKEFSNYPFDNAVLLESIEQYYWNHYRFEKVEFDRASTIQTDKSKLTTLPTDSKERKDYPLYEGCLRYFPAAISGVANVSKLGNDKHNPGQELHHARGKSMDHGDCIVRHLLDVADLLSAMSRGDDKVTSQNVLLEVNQMAWRALAFSQELHEKFGAPLAPGAKK